MVKPFQFARGPEILFGNGMISGLPQYVKIYGNKIALVTGKSSFINSSHAERLFHNLAANNIGFKLISIPGEPSPGDIDMNVISLKDDGIDLVVGIGGGSVLDAGKAISAMIHKPESVVRFLEGVGDMDHPGTKLPYIAIPTTSGTGSEATKNAVISKIGTNGYKKSLRHNNLVPDIALIDPELTLECPPEITAASGMDCFTQLTEAFLSVKSNEYTDALALEGLKVIKVSLERCCADGHDLKARTGMSFAALTSGICLANAGLGVVHGFASSLGGLYNIPHGLVCGTLMAKANEINVRILRKNPESKAALRKYAVLGRLFLEDKATSDDFYIDGFIEYLHKLTHDLGLFGLKKFGIDKKDISSICMKTENKNNPVKLVPEELAEIILSGL
jgi:alcohol dehydrogenase class IV